MSSAYFFESQGRNLFGIYHKPKGASAREEVAVLICAPVGLEFIRTHWAIRQLATHLTHMGVHVFRFDYSGTGDSEGDVSEVRVELWLHDIQAAARELQEISGLTKLNIVGLRLGATLAAHAIAMSAVKAREAVFWDPVVEGRTYLAGLETMQKRKVRYWRFARGPLHADEILGFPFPAELHAGIQALDLTKLSKLPVERIHLVTSKKDKQYEKLRTSIATGTEFTLVPDMGDWDELEETEAALLAGRIVQAVATAAAGKRCE